MEQSPQKQQRDLENHQLDQILSSQLKQLIQQEAKTE